jgi:hypothetical protein
VQENVPVQTAGGANRTRDRSVGNALFCHAAVHDREIKEGVPSRTVAKTGKLFSSCPHFHPGRVKEHRDSALNDAPGPGVIGRSPGPLSSSTATNNSEV